MTPQSKNLLEILRDGGFYARRGNAGWMYIFAWTPPETYLGGRKQQFVSFPPSVIEELKSKGYIDDEFKITPEGMKVVG